MGDQHTVKDASVQALLWWDSVVDSVCQQWGVPPVQLTPRWAGKRPSYRLMAARRAVARQVARWAAGDLRLASRWLRLLLGLHPKTIDRLLRRALRG